MANNKLQNVKAVKEMLSGTHKFQTNKTFGYTKKQDIKRNIGDKWTEITPNGTQIQWEQKDGFRVKTAVNSILDEINKILKMPDKCPKCNSNMYNEEEKLNKKFWSLEKQCFSCVVKMETLLRGEGKYKEYERKKLLQNAESWFKDADKEVEILKEALGQKIQFVQNKDGELEEYDQTDYKENFTEYIDNQYDRFKKELITSLKEK